MEKRKLETVKEIVSVLMHAVDVAIDEEDRFEMMVKEYEYKHKLRGEDDVTAN